MQLTGQKREILGKKVKNIRADRQLPAVIFGKGLESLFRCVILHECTLLNRFTLPLIIRK